MGQRNIEVEKAEEREEFQLLSKIHNAFVFL